MSSDLLAIHSPSDNESLDKISDVYYLDAVLMGCYALEPLSCWAAMH